MLNILKWLGTACVILAAVCRSAQYHSADMALSIVGAIIWGYAAVKMRDIPLFVVNGFITAVLLFGVFRG